MYHGWFRLCLSADGSTATAGEEEAPAPGHLPFWFKPVSAFGLLKFTTFISSSPELAMPSTLAPDRLSASSRRVLSRETRPPGSGEVTLSQELRTVGFLRPHVLVGYQWSHTGLCPGCRPVITATSAASCRTRLYSVCHRTRQFLRTNQSISPRSPPPERRPFSRGRRHSTPGAPGMPAGWPSAAMPLPSLSLRSLRITQAVPLTEYAPKPTRAAETIAKSSIPSVLR